MHATIDRLNPTGFLPIERARELAAQMRLSDMDDDWTYEVHDCGNGFGRVDVKDEDGECIIKGFMA